MPNRRKKSARVRRTNSIASGKVKNLSKRERTEYRNKDR